MIKYALKCSEAHQFEGWFSSSDDFDRQKAEALLACPVCGSADVSKALMAPAVRTSRGRAAPGEAMQVVSQEWNELARKAKAYVESHFEDVGRRFPEEARKQHYGEAEAKPIYGEASPKEIRELKDEGVTVAPVPQPIPSPDETKKKLN